jgi:phosphocarrier protein
MNNTINVRLQILNEKGLHARAAAKFVELVDTFDVNVVVVKDNLEASGDSIMGLLMLASKLSFTTTTLTSNVSTNSTNLAAARACRPFSFKI